MRSAAPSTTTEALEEAIRRGRELVDRGEEVLDEASYRRWRQAKREWAYRTFQTLILQFALEAAEEFMHANRTSGETWDERLRHDLRATRNAIELIHWLGTTLRGWRSDAYPNGRLRPHAQRSAAPRPRGW